MTDPNARRVYVYEVEPSKEDGNVLRIMRVAITKEHPGLYDEDNPWVGIKSAKLVTVAVLDPRIAA